jgi:phosphoribosylformylglycinamidine synthase I
MSLKALVLTGYGINCERESKYAIEKSGGAADIMHINKVMEAPRCLENYNMLMIPGGFSFGDDLGSGKVYGSKMRFRLHDQLEDFIKKGNLILGVCNGFQVMVKMGMLPEPDFKQRVTLTNNDSGHFEDRWVILKANPQSPCVFTKGVGRILMPIRHGEGKFIPKDDSIMADLRTSNQIVLQYVDENDNLAGYPYNPNGSAQNIAGICDKSGRVFGLMPHPEAFNIVENCPLWIKGVIKEPMGLSVFKNAVAFMKEKG